MTGQIKKALLAEIDRWNSLLEIMLAYESNFMGCARTDRVSLKDYKEHLSSFDVETLTRELTCIKEASYDFMGRFVGAESPEQSAFAKGLKDYYFEKTGRSLFSDYPPHMRLLKAILRRGFIWDELELYLAKEGSAYLAGDSENTALDRNLKILIEEYESRN